MASEEPATKKTKTEDAKEATIVDAQLVADNDLELDDGWADGPAEKASDTLASKPTEENAAEKPAEQLAEKPVVTEVAKEDAPPVERKPHQLSVYCSSINANCPEAQFELDMEECGEINAFKFFESERWGATNAAIVTYATEAGVEAALARNGEEYWSKPMSVALAREKNVGPGPTDFTVRIKGLPQTQENLEEDLKKFFAECGEIEKVNIPRDEIQQTKGFAYVDFKDASSVPKAIELNEKEFGAKKQVVNVFLHKEKGKGKGKGDESPDEIFVKGLPESTTEESLKKYFAECGDIEAVKLPMEDGQVRGFAFVKFKTHEMVTKACDLDGKEYEGSALEIKPSSEKKGKGKGKGGKGGKGKGKGKGKKGKRW